MKKLPTGALAASLRYTSGGAVNRPWKELEAKPRLHLDRPRRQRILRFTEVSVLDVRLRIEQIQLVEQVIEVSAKFQFRVFTQDWQFRQPERLTEGCVHIEVPRPSKGVTSNPRRCWNGAKRLLTQWAKGYRRIREEAVVQGASNNRRLREEQRLHGAAGRDFSGGPDAARFSAGQL